LYWALVLSSLIALIITLHFATPALGDSVPLLKIKTDNPTLKHELPKFYHCISSQVWHSKDKQKDPYFKTEPTLNEVLKCYDKILAKQTDSNDGKSEDKK
jgi:hypothetical protein